MTAAIDASRITFLMVGCQRSGTTWVDAALREHPEVYLPAQKQTYFFDRNYEKGMEWWLANFQGVGPGHKAVGEVATGYCLLHAAPLVARHLARARLIMTMRNPVERAYSYYLTLQDESGRKSFGEALQEKPDIIERGQYADQVEALLEHFPREQLLLLFYDDLSKDDRAYLGSILRFIGVDAGFESTQFGKMKNSAMFPRARRVMKRAGLSPVVYAVSRSPLGDAIRKGRKRLGKGYGAMPAADKARLIEHYRPYNERLSALTGRDLSHWSR